MIYYWFPFKFPFCSAWTSFYSTPTYINPVVETFPPSSPFSLKASPNENKLYLASPLWPFGGPTIPTGVNAGTSPGTRFPSPSPSFIRSRDVAEGCYLHELISRSRQYRAAPTRERGRGTSRTPSRVGCDVLHPSAMLPVSPRSPRRARRPARPRPQLSACPIGAVRVRHQLPGGSSPLCSRSPSRRAAVGAARRGAERGREPGTGPKGG